jgi:molecular chaperone DnaJ
MRDPYSVLGVSRQANADEIKAAFRRLAREHHPDRNPNDASAEQRFREINEAYQVLSDPNRRARFDATGSDRSAPGPGPGNTGQAGGFGGFEDLLGELFGALGRRPTSRGDMRLVVEVSFREAALGCTKSLSYERIDACGDCDGSGGKAGAGFRTCAACGGAGRISGSIGGWFAVRTEQVCPQCGGRGRLPKVACAGCQGRGLASDKRTIDVKLPPGIEAGAALPVAGGGSRPAPGAPTGDLELVVQINPDPMFTREGDDVVSELPVTFVQAALGAELGVDTLRGRQTLRIPAGSRSGDELRLKGMGVPHRFRSGAGYHRVKLRLTVPEKLSPRARDLLQQFDAACQQGDDGLLGKLFGLFQ